MRACCPSGSLPGAILSSQRSNHRSKEPARAFDRGAIGKFDLRKRRRVLQARSSAPAREGNCAPIKSGRENGAVIVQDDLDLLLKILPGSIRKKLLKHPKRSELLEVVLDLGRRPEARFLKHRGGEFLSEQEVTRDDLLAAEDAVGQFGGDNRAGIEGTLHRISAMRNRKGAIIGLTCRVGRSVTGHADMVRDLLDSGKSILLLGRPGVGKTTVIREIARVLSDDLHKRVVVVDTSNEIGGDGDVPHPAIGGARRMQVSNPSMQHKVMVEAVENHMPQVVIVDEIGTEAEALACRTIAERGVMLVATAHGQTLENIIKNPMLSDLVGGIQSVTLGDDTARSRKSQKTVLERKAPPTFLYLVEMRDRGLWIAHQSDRSVDSLLRGESPTVEMRTRDENFRLVIRERLYDEVVNESSDTSVPVMAHLTPSGPSKFKSWVEIADYGDSDPAYNETLKHAEVTNANKKYTSSLEQVLEDNGFLPPGKRGSKRGPRGIRPR